MRVRLETEESNVSIAIADEGIGIDPAEQKHLFTKFYVSPQSADVAGSGLGLYISQEIVRRHGGTLQAETPEDGGTRMVMSLPRP